MKLLLLSGASEDYTSSASEPSDLAERGTTSSRKTDSRETASKSTDDKKGKGEKGWYTL